MDLKNIISAVTLSIAIIVLYTLFFQPSPEEMKKLRVEKEKKELVNNSDTPSLDEKNNFTKLSREDAMRDAKFVGDTGQDEDREAARAIQQTLGTKANEHLTFGYFEKAIVNFHSHLAKHLDQYEVVSALYY